MTLDQLLAAGGKWLAEHYHPDIMTEEAAWGAALKAIIPEDPAELMEAGQEVLDRAKAGDTCAWASVNLVYEEREDTDIAAKILTDVRAVVETYLINAGGSGLWDISSDLRPELWEED